MPMNYIEELEKKKKEFGYKDGLGQFEARHDFPSNPDGILRAIQNFRTETALSNVIDSNAQPNCVRID